MAEFRYNGAIALFIYKRIEFLDDIFNSIIKNTSGPIYIISDGPKNEDERIVIHNIREKVKETFANISDVTYLFSETNNGVALQFLNGLNHVFLKEDTAIILEDDCLPDDSFYLYCDTMLKKYAVDDAILSISGFNILGEVATSDSHFLSRFSLMNWGWATWKRSWKKYDYYMSDFYDCIDDCLYKYVSSDNRNYFRKSFEELLVNKLTWDAQWNYMMWKYNAYCVIPPRNLIAHVGYGENATFMKIDESDASDYTRIFTWELPATLNVTKQVNYDLLIEESLILLIKKMAEAYKKYS